MRPGPRVIACLLCVASLTACSRQPGAFSERNARTHVEMLAGTIGSRPAGSEANARARAYLVEQLKVFGYQVRVQETDARRPELGRTARVANIIGVLPGPRREGLGLLAHYDSRGDTPGAGDDAFGVAVALEAARLLAASGARQWTTYVLLTDAEEEGLMGAAGLMTDPQVRDYLAAYINIEASGSGNPVMLFETGPGNSWLLSPWAKRAPHPRGGSFAVEIYKRLPNDTDFSILKRHQIPGLNFAAVGDSYAYHTARDTPDRLSGPALSNTGDNVVAIASALQQSDITARTDRDATYFDLAGTIGVRFGSAGSWITSLLSVLLGMLGWLRITRFLLCEEGAGRWLLGLAWTIVAVIATIAAMIAGAAVLRAAREVYHPWYARPDRLFVMLTAVGGAMAWMMARAGRWIPARAHGLRHPAVAWTYALPLWIPLALFMSWAAPSAAYLWTRPLLAAGLLLVAVPPSSAPAIRLASVVILAVTGTLWLGNTVDLLRFIVAVLGRLSIVTPVYVYPAGIAAAGLMIAPALFAATAAPKALLRPSLATALALAGVAAAVLWAWMAPAYTYEQPLRRYVRALQHPGAATAAWRVGSLEPGLDLGIGAPSGWTTAEPGADTMGWLSLAQPFLFTADGPPLGPAPAVVTAFNLTPAGAGTALTLSIVPREQALSVSFVLPAGITPARSNFPGVTRLGRWTATFAAVPAEGIAWQAAFSAATAEQLRGSRLVVRTSGLPGAAGWQRLPGWLPQERMVWNAGFTWMLDPSAPPPIEPVPPLR